MKGLTRVAIVGFLGSLTMLQSEGPSGAMRMAIRDLQLPSSLDLGAVSTRDGFTAALRMMRKPGGVVTVRSGDCEVESRKFFTLPGGFPLDHALDALVGIESNSFWVLNNGAINLIPAQGLPPIMQVRVPDFEWDTSDFVRRTMDRLFLSGPVRTFLEGAERERGIISIVQPSKPPRIINGVAVPENPGERHVIREQRLIDLLNSIVASYGDGVWSYQEWSCGGKKYFQIFAQ